MKKTKVKTKEGDLFVVPLIQGGYALGLIARQFKKIVLGYFFAKVYPQVPESVIGSDLKVEKIIFIGKFSSLAFEDGNWPLVKAENFVFNRDEWVIPVFKMQHPLTEEYFAVIYDETLLNEKRYKITKEDADKLFKYGLNGYENLREILSEILDKKV